ncbi:type VI secretion system membrane subunit TssM [Tateyamaria sp.]|uniref:type VI secretion system membrane subunit TssM n=1 Tax=Tateyamaria sp. TaxID=1929288 RepID=UPI0032A01A44
MIRVFSWLSALITTLGVVSLCVAIWVGLPISGITWLSLVPVRIGLIVAILSLLLLSAVLRWQARRKAAEDLETSLLASQAGDGPLLAERMRAALSRLKKIGGAAALYDLPWYVLIGPPGAGKTTALVHSGLDFPGDHAASISGFGGTKNCDFWFAQEAVMIDTAGRYTTQDSDETADRNSWTAFLGQLKSARPDQPINGVILAFSCADMMTETGGGLIAHAQTVRARLAELNAAFNTHVPVYVIFTKADMIAGFREYFGSFDEDRRKGVWGATFQTRNRRTETHRAVAKEFETLVGRLSDEVTDRLMEETDSATRIAVYGFPEQIALLERNVTSFLSAIFENPQKIHAILRGFYFTSGTQEGTPIDQVLGAMNARAGGGQAGFLSGKGRSYFLHDLLKTVIFAERDWVGYDRGRVMRRAFVRASGKAAIALACVGVMAVLGISFWKNATLVREVAGQTQLYEQRAAAFLGPQQVDDPATRPLLPALGTMRAIPAGYANPHSQPFIEQVGLSRRDVLASANVQAYSDSLEQLLRPRMMLQVERDLAQFIEAGRKVDAYRALKVYILLAKEQDGREDDLAIQSYFAQSWAEDYIGADEEYRAINAHLAAMLELDSRVTPLVAANGALIDRARDVVADVSSAERAYGAVRSAAGTLPSVSLFEAADDTSGLGTTDGRPLATLQVPGLYSADGYWDFFAPAVVDAGAQLERDAWVLGPADTGALVSDAQLSADLYALYARDFERAWRGVLGRVALVDTLGQIDRLGDAETSAFVRLVGAIKVRTNLTNSLKYNDNASEFAAVRAGVIERPFLDWHATPFIEHALASVRQAREVARTGQGDLAATLPDNASYPETVVRLLGQVREALSPTFVDAQLMALDQTRCVAGGPVVGVGFGAVFGPGGQMERLTASAPGPVSTRARDRFAAARDVRAAFFGQGAEDPLVLFGIRLMAVSPPIAPVTVRIGEQVLDLTPGGALLPARWTGAGSVALSVPDQPPIELPGGGWSILTLLSGEGLQSRGPVAQVSHDLGPYTATFRLEFGGADVPFLMQSFQEITCQNAIK